MLYKVFSKARRVGLCALAALAVWVAAPPAVSGQPGPPPLRVLVELDAIAAPEARLSSAAARGQRQRIAHVRESLEARLRGSGVRVVQRYESLPLVALEVPHNALGLLASSEDVVVIEGDRLHAPSLADSGPQIEATDVHALGYDGSGWHIAVLDTGVDVDHPALAGRVDDEACFSALGDCGGATESFGSGAAAPCALSGCFHGTHVAGIALGEDATHRGIAPGARLLAVQVFSMITGDPCPGGGTNTCVLAYTSDIIRGLEHIYQLRDTYQIAAVNLSLGGGAYTSQSQCDLENGAMLFAIDNLRSAGIATVAASGNDGFVNAMGSPACLSAAVSVGSVTKQGAVSSFSNSTNFLNLLAPGSSIVSAVPGTGFGSASGTSMATPHVAGAWALCLERNGATPVDEVLTDLATSGLLVLDGGNGLEHPLLQLEVNFVPEPGSGALATAALLALGACARRRRYRASSSLR